MDEFTLPVIGRGSPQKAISDIHEDETGSMHILQVRTLQACVSADVHTLVTFQNMEFLQNLI